MRSRDVVGKRIVAVHQEQVSHGWTQAWHVSAIELEDGTTIEPSVREGDGYYSVEMATYRRGRDGKVRRNGKPVNARGDQA